MDVRAILMGLAFVVMWSSAFSSARIIVADAPPLNALALRFLISGLIGVAIARALGQSWTLSRGQWWATLLFGVCQNAIYLGLNFVAMQTVEASLASIVASTMPLLVALAGWVVFRERLSLLGFTGLVAGTIGVVIIMGTRIGAGVDLFGLSLTGIGVLGLTFATLAVRGTGGGKNMLMIVGLQMLVGAAVLAPFGLWLEDPSVTLSTPLVLAFVYTTLIPGLAATLVWFHLVDRIGMVRAATFHFLNPFFGVLIAAILLNEAVRAADLLGVVIIMLGILAVQMAKVRHHKHT
ncbi:MAG: EamA family transporter [Rhodobacteraceae bacterium]|nr:EamA family transporter [Paracoccaceae bacterium]